MRTTNKLFTIVCIGLVLAAVVPAQQRRKKRTPMTKQPQVEYLSSQRPRPAPFSDAVRVGNMLYLSGKLGTDSSGLVAGGIKAETKQTLENIGALLERSGSSFDQVVKCTVMLADMGEWGAMNEVYVTFFPKDRLPARSAFGVSGLALNARVEIECIATVR